MTQTSRLVDWSTGIYDLLVRAYPRSFRQDYGDELRLIFRELVTDSWDRGGWLGVTRAWCRVFVDLVQTLPQQHFLACKGMPMKPSFAIAFVAGLALICAGWLVDYNGGGDPHWLDGIGLLLIVSVALAAAITPLPERLTESPPYVAAPTPSRRVAIASSMLSLTTAGLVYTFITDAVVIGNRRQPMVGTPKREIMTVVTLVLVFILSRSVLNRIQRIPAARRFRTLMILMSGGLTSVFVAVSAACLLTYWFWLHGVSVHPDLLYVLTFVGALLLLLMVTRTVLNYCDRSGNPVECGPIA